MKPTASHVPYAEESSSSRLEASLRVAEPTSRLWTEQSLIERNVIAYADTTSYCTCSGKTRFKSHRGVCVRLLAIETLPVLLVIESNRLASTLQSSVRLQ